MINLESAFNFLINAKGKVRTLHDLETDTQVSFKIAKANYFRNFEGVEEININGREFVISKKLLDESGFPALKRNIRVVDEGTSFTITKIEEMEALNGQILGYRVETS